MRRNGFVLAVRRTWRRIWRLWARIAHVVGLVGDDAAGKGIDREFAFALLERCGEIRSDHGDALGRETITKTRFLAGAKLTSRQQVLRLDRQPVASPDARLMVELCERIRRVDGEVDAWIASDYGYGMFDDGIRKVLRDIAGSKCVMADSRWELQRFAGMTVVKPNEEEAEELGRRFGVAAADVVELARALTKKLEAKSVLVTLGNEGMVLAADGRVVRIAASGGDEIVDLTGAGDSVAATLVAAMASGAEIETAARLANHAGGIVVMKEGAATASPDELHEAIDRAEAKA